MEITNHTEYAEAIDRANRLRRGGSTAISCLELAALDGEINVYEQKMDIPATRPGRTSHGEA
ncbi:MAG: hypothetical protein WAS73_14380 [Defluviicoccus sp.]